MVSIKTIGKIVISIIVTIVIGCFYIGLWHLPEHIPLNEALFIILVLWSIAINTYWIRSYIGSPKDIFITSLTILSFLLPVYNQSIIPTVVFNALVCYYTLMAIIALISMINYNLGSASLISSFCREIAIVLGGVEKQYCVLLGVLVYPLMLTSLGFALITIFIATFLFFTPNLIEFICTICIRKSHNVALIGQMTAVQSASIFLADLYELSKRESVWHFNFVIVRHSIDEKLYYGLVIDRYDLDSHQKIKILKLKIKEDTTIKQSQYESNQVYLITTEQEIDTLKELAKNFVGTVITHSDISKIRFEYSSLQPLYIGDFVEVKVQTQRVFYQITQATTDIKTFENNNESGIIVSTATQVGTFNKDTRNFEKYGWVPSTNTSVYIANKIEEVSIKDQELTLGTVDKIELDVLANIEELITHHTAILGTTGTGKSVFARDLIKKYAEKGYKVFCIDFTGEMKKYLPTQNLVNKDIFCDFIPDNLNSPCKMAVEEIIKWIAKNQGANYGKDPQNMPNNIKYLENYFKICIEEFVNGGQNIGLLELDGLSNTDESLVYTKYFVKVLFSCASEGMFKDRLGCLVLEEAHTIIPEWNSRGTDDKHSNGAVNTIAQVALQGRKYNLGLMVIAQRTANVSKTVLTQCNTIVAFKQFDNTSRDFLENHLGSEYTSALSLLKPRYAVIVGKALVSDVPLIFKVPDIIEKPIKQLENTDAI